MRNPTVNPHSATTQSGGDSNHIILPKAEVLDQSLARVLQSAGLAASRSEGTRMLASGAVYVATGRGANEGNVLQYTQVKDPKEIVKDEQLISGKLLLRVGKWKTKIIEVVGDETP